MKTNSSSTRRQFLKGTASVVGLTALNLIPGTALARGLGLAPGAGEKVSIAYWDGFHLIPADRLPAGDPTLERVTLTMHGYGRDGALRAVDVNALIHDGAGDDIPAPFHAWIAPPQGCAEVKFVTPVAPAQGLLLTVHQRQSEGETASNVLMSVGTDTGPKLKEGKYIFAAGAVDLTAFTLLAEAGPQTLVRIRGAGGDIPYMAMIVERV